MAFILLIITSFSSAMVIVLKGSPLQSGLEALQAPRPDRSAFVIRLLWPPLLPSPRLPSTALLSSAFPFLQSGETVSPRSIPLPQCFHTALITPICRHSKHMSVCVRRCCALSVEGVCQFCCLASFTSPAITLEERNTNYKVSNQSKENAAGLGLFYELISHK